MHHLGIEDAALRVRVIDHFVHDHAAVTVQGEDGVIDEHNGGVALSPGFQNVALINGIANRQCRFHAVRMGDGYRPLAFAHLADGLAQAGKSDPRRLRHHGGGMRPRQVRHHIRGQHGTVRRFQGGGI